MKVFWLKKLIYKEEIFFPPIIVICLKVKIDLFVSGTTEEIDKRVWLTDNNP